MIAYLLLNSFLLFKLLIYILLRIFLIPNIFAKYLLIAILTIVLFFCYKYPKNHILIKRDLFKYALKTRWSHIYNIITISSYIILFVGGVFYLRFLNIEKKIDLKDYYVICKKFFIDYPWNEIIINSILVILFIILYITLLYKLTLYFKFHIIKRHIFLIGKPWNDSWYYETFHYKFFTTINIHTTIFVGIILKIKNYYNKYYFSKQNKKEPYNYKEMSLKEQILFEEASPATPYGFISKYKIKFIVYHLLTKWHYLLLLFVTFYDMKFNNFTLTSIFYILPWTFFYELYLRLTLFQDNLWLPYDQALHNLIYSKHLEQIDDDTLSIDGEFHDISYYKNMSKHYILRGFVKDPEHI